MEIFASGKTDSLFCGKATAVATCHRHVAKSRLSNPSSKYPNAEKDQSKRIGLFLALLNLMYIFD
jgi:hypothetical protein